MFNGTNLAKNSVIHIKARESSDTRMSTCDGVRHIPGHSKLNKTLALLLLIGGCSAGADPEGEPPPPSKITKI